MLRRYQLLITGFVLATIVSAASSVGAIPADQLLPATTKGYLSVPDVDVLREQWNKTRLGELMNDPVMKPFADDLRRQLESKLRRTRVRLGVTWDDLADVYGGEVCFAIVQPENDEKQHATVLIVDITDHATGTDNLMKKISKSLIDQNATRETQQHESTTLTVFTLPKKRGETTERQVIHVVHQNRLVMSDHLQTAKDILDNLAQDSPTCLATLKTYRYVMDKCEEDANNVSAQIQWYFDPFGYVEVLRAARGGRKKRGKDLLKILREQGFAAIQAAGGRFAFATEDHDLTHRTMVYAPPETKSSDEQPAHKYKLAARMLDFPNGAGHSVQPWIPRELGTFLTFNWKIKEAFEHSSTLVDAIAGDEGFFEDLLSSIATDEFGPQIDIRKQLVSHFGVRATAISDYVLPISPSSERVLFAIELTDEEAVRKTLNKAMEDDPDARRVEVDGHVVWEIVSEDDDDVPELELDDPVFEIEDEEEDPRILSNAAMTVLHNHLVVATHLDFVKKVIEEFDPDDSIADSADYKLVNEALDSLGAGSHSFRFFSRTDEEYRPTYELIRQGKMPEAETMLGKTINYFFGPEEEGTLREQQIDGTELPDYDAVRRYLGPAGFYIRTLEDGWMATGALLSKQASFREREPQVLPSTAANKDRLR